MSSYEVSIPEAITDIVAVVPIYKELEDGHRLFVPYFALKHMQRMD